MSVFLVTFLLLSVETPSNETSSLHSPLLWKTGNDLPGFVDTLVLSWCNTTSQDAVKHSRAAQGELRRCMSAKNNSTKALQDCELDKRNMHVTFEENKLMLEANLSAAEAKARAQAAYWKELSEKRISVAECNYQKQAAISKTQLGVFEEKTFSNVASCEDELRLEQTKLGSLDDLLASCRLELAHADATLKTSPEQAVIKELKEQIRRLYLILTCCGALLFGLVPAMMFLQAPKKNGQEVECDGETIEVLTSEQARNKLELTEGGEISVRPLLTSLVVEGKELYFLLVPFNSHRRRRFALFGGGGDYSWEAEAARVTASRENGVSLILLYDYTGHAFSEASLKKLQLTPEMIAMEVVPRDTEFPSKDDIGVLWKSSKGLFISNVDGVLQVPSTLWEQVWIQYLCR